MLHKEYIDVYSENVKKLYHAYNMGVDYLTTHSIIDIKDILIKDLAFSENIIDLIELPKYTKAEQPRLEDLKKASEWLSQKGLVDKNFDCKSLLDSTVIPIE